MNKPFPLKPLIDLTQVRLDDATRKLGELIALEQEGHRKLELLQSYRAEYAARFEEAARNGIGAEAWRNYSAFLVRIDEAVEVQRKAVDQSRQRTLAGRENWTQHRNKLKAFDTLEQRHLATQSRLVARSEQKLVDEHSAKRFRDRNDESSDH